MILYPSINHSSKAPRQPCIAFSKIDGSQVRCKYTRKKGFCLFGTKNQLIDNTTPFWNRIIEAFKPYENSFLEAFDKKDYRDYREIVVFGEFAGSQSFAGRHNENEKQDLCFFDVLVGHKNPRFVLPQDFIKDFAAVPQPEVIYQGKLTDGFIEKIRNDTTLREGVICKGTTKVGNARGGVWMCKIKTKLYFQKLKEVFGKEWINYWE